jgi:small subunit ribosomal protein S4e
MAKRGERKHQKRIAKPKAIPLTDKKASIWVTRAMPGPHPRKNALPLSVLIKDVLGLAKTTKEAKIILNNRLVLVDGKVRCEAKFPVGLMDIVSFPKAEKHFRIVVDWKGRRKPVPIKEVEAGKKFLRIVKKHIAPKSKINITTHDGRNMYSDNHIHIGDTLVTSLPKAKLENHIKLESGAKCLIIEGKHAGMLVKLNEIIARKAGKPAEANVSGESGDFITVAKYLFVVDESFEVSK